MVAASIRAFLPRAVRPAGYLGREVFAKTRGRVHSGPFQGMLYIRESFASCYIPKVLGIYERELHTVIEQACQLRPDLIVDIGAAEGYYAAGMALRNPGTRVVAFEMEETGRARLRKLVALNNLQAAVEVRGKCEADELQSLLTWANAPLVICDCEGYEVVLLDPQTVNGLGNASILVEIHEFLAPGAAATLSQRFSISHEIAQIAATDRSPGEYPFRSLYYMLLPGRYRRSVVGEWRPPGMSWLWMRPRNLPRGPA
ncbi:MAG TPA: hypothetical protein VMS17_10035 [Gemmataceae bacterium]|nr:hypothetical protein [Gemmataceae bacterium]